MPWLLPPLAGIGRPKLVVDVGSGAGLSARYWAAHAVEVVGVEPSEANPGVTSRRSIPPAPAVATSATA